MDPMNNKINLPMIDIRDYKSEDIKEILQLFYDTVHEVNAKDYTEEQLDAWASKDVDLTAWDKSLLSHYSYVAVLYNTIVSFGDINDEGYLDRLYVHKDYQGKGIGSAICNKLETVLNFKTIYVHASITAKPFFEKRGYSVVKEQTVMRHGVSLKNYIMIRTVR